MKWKESKERRGGGRQTEIGQSEGSVGERTGMEILRWWMEDEFGCWRLKQEEIERDCE